MPSAIFLHLRVDAISISAFTRSCLMKIAAETQWDPILPTVHRLTLNGWLDRCTNVPKIARNYWDFWDKLSIEDDLLMKGEWVIIPPSCRDAIMDILQKSHAGINKAMALARTCVYWPGVEADVTDYIKRCLMYIKSSNLPIETLHPHEVPPGPWVKLGIDFFQDHHGKKYLIIADYFSKSSQWHLHIISRPSTISENSSQLKAYLPLWCLTMALHSMETNSKGLLESWTLCTLHHHLISTNPMASLRPWWRKSRTPTRKLMDLPVLKPEH